MRKIGIIYGAEDTFPSALIASINEQEISGIVAEAVLIGSALSADKSDYAVLFDRGAIDIPFYAAYLRKASLEGVAVINNPFTVFSLDFYSICTLANSLGIQVPKLALLPSWKPSIFTNDSSFKNLQYPLEWFKIADYVGFPALLKSAAGASTHPLARVNSIEEVWQQQAYTDTLATVLQQEIAYEDYYQCYCIGGVARVVAYEPRNPYHLRFATMPKLPEELGASIRETIQQQAIKLQMAIGLDFCSFEFAVTNGAPVLTAVHHSYPDAHLNALGQEHFGWLLQNLSDYLIERARKKPSKEVNLTWGRWTCSDTIPVESQLPAGKVAQRLLKKKK